MHFRAVSSCVFVLAVALGGCGGPGHAAPAAEGSLDGSVSSGSGYPVASSPDAAIADDAGGGSSSGAGAEAGGPSPPSCSTTPVWSPGTSQTISIAFGDAGLRSYDVYVGTGVKAGSAVPLLVNMHGWTNSPALQAQFSQMNPVADANGFVVVYPAGLDASFNAGGCCGTSAADGVDDVGFVRAVVADAESKICIDAKRVYETGFSNGGMMSYQLACNAADLFAAVAPTEGDNETTAPCTPSRPVPLAAFQYLADPLVLASQAQQSATAWATQVGCTDAAPAQTMEAAFSCSEWSPCSGGALVWYCTLPGGTHYPPVGSAPVIWQFLSQFALP
jgi:polyhydroxybutyrate depolymerase